MSSIFTNSQQIKTNSNAMADLELSKVNYEIYTEGKYQEIQQSILDTTEKIQELEATLDTLRKRLGFYKAAVAPHKQLPTDILRRIFVLCARAYGSVQIPWWYNRRLIDCKVPTSLVLSHVCTPWRQLAFSTGELWSDIQMISRSSSLISIDVCEFWLKHAGHFPVSVKLGDCYDSMIKPAIIQKMSRPARVTYLDLAICCSPSNLSILRNGVLPDVKDVRLSAEFDSDILLPSQLPSFFKHTKFFHCRGGLLDQNVTNLTPIWSGLCYLDLGDAMTTATQCLYILGETVSLEMCRLNVTASLQMGLQPDFRWDEFILPELRILILAADNPSFHLIITSISTPRLMKLSLRGLWRNLDVGDKTIGILAERFNLYQLEELELLFNVCNRSIDVLLRNAPSLRRIVFSYWHKGNMTNTIISGLATGNLGPCLESIEVPSVSDRDELFEILEMVEARQRNSAYNEITPLRNVRISTESLLPQYEYLSRITKLRELGVETIIDGNPRKESDPDGKDELTYDWSKLLRPIHVRVRKSY
ncbi:hypothetical protein AX17_003849 [Amanita inopinata Kibby_2008]|nr:hypothetical protein AX17_003849 [Amanita inopinata Kibby_2008]